MTVSTVKNKSGTVSYRVYLGTVHGKKKYRQFKEQKDADAFAYESNIKIKANEYKQTVGELGELLTVKYEALECLNRLRAVGATLRDATDYYIRFAKPVNGTITVGDAINEFIQIKTASRRSKKYLYTLANFNFKVFRAYFKADTKLSDITAKSFTTYLYSQKTWNPTSQISHIKVINVLFNFCKRRGYLTKNPLNEIEMPQKENKRVTVLEVSQVQQLLGTAWNHKWYDRAAIAALVLFAGVRVEEAVKLKWSDFNWRKRVVLISEAIAKKRRHRYNELPDNCFEWILWARPDDYRTSTELILEGDFKWKLFYLRDQSGIKYEQNAMRHSFASYHIARFNSPEITCLLLGHIGDYRMLFQHYRWAVNPSVANEYFNILPPELKRVDGVDPYEEPRKNEINKAEVSLWVRSQIESDENNQFDVKR